jgi:hypothetical protein
MEENDKKNAYKNLVMRCPRLGGEVPFSYCEQEGGDIPCRLVLDCWRRIFPVDSYLQEILSEEARSRFDSQTPKDRLSSLLDVVEKAKKRLQAEQM